MQHPNWDGCLCHVRDDATGSLTRFTDTSWRKFEECANKRLDQIYSVMKDHWDDGPKGFYHRQCYQKYTNIAYLSRKETVSSAPFAESDFTSSCGPTIPKRLRSNSIEFKEEKCIICQKEKVIKGRPGNPRTREPLSQNVSETGSSSLLKAAQIRENDHVLLQITGQDTIAKEIKYHRSCYKDFTKADSLAKIEERNCEHEDNRTHAYNDAFQEIRRCVQMEVIWKNKIVSISDLTSQFMIELSKRGVDVSDYRSSKLKERLKKSFGDLLSFKQPVRKNESELIYHTHVERGEFAEAAFKQLLPETSDASSLNTSREDNDQNAAYDIYHASKLLRKLILDVETAMKWPPVAEDLDDGASVVPDLVYNMLCWILSSDCEYSESRIEDVPNQIHRLALSVSQDLVHCVTRGRIKTPKHVALPLTVKSLTGNAEVITLLNRFGHGLSYTQILELETALAEKQISSQRDGVLLPSVCQPGIPATFCWDNNDIQEETLSGKGTTHCTNGIIVQRRPLTCALPPAMQATQSRRSKKRSLTEACSDLLPYHSVHRKGPPPVHIDVNRVIVYDPEVLYQAQLIDFGWMLSRQPVEDTLFDYSDDRQQVIPSWTAFNMMLQEPHRESTVGYCPVIEASPTELPTVFNVLKQSLQMADQLGQRDVIVVFDQAIYAKALEIQWQNQDEFQRMVIRLGAFHTICAFIAAIGKRFGDAGLSDILIESGIVASGSVSGVLEGRHYNRAIRTHKIIFEAMHRLLWQSFKTWLQFHCKSVNYPTIVRHIQQIREEFNKEELEKLLTSEELAKVFLLYQEFSKESNGPLQEFWISYLEMVSTLLGFIRATREGNWPLHLDCTRRMLPWFFAYDHVNYSRYLSLYLVQMLRLDETHPEAHSMLVGGDFGVQRSSSQGFTQVPVDQTIEQTLNRSTKTKGGIIGFSLKKGAVQRWIVTAHSRAAFVDKCRLMTATELQSSTPKEQGSLRMKRDEDDVERVREVIINWQNPFETTEELTSISTGKLASDTTKLDLVTAKARGSDAFASFVEARVISGSQDFFDPIKKMKLGTFSDAQAKKRVTSGGRDIIIKADRNLFARLLVIGQNRQMNLQEVLAHELGPVPWSLASPDGTMAKTNKAALSKLLENGVEFLQNQPRDSAVIIDSMAMLQTLTRIPEKFSELADIVINIVFHSAGDAKRIDVVADQYPCISIKNAERSRRSKHGQISVKITSPEQLCPRQWKKTMSSGESKTNLMHFLAEEWASDRHAEKIGDRSLYVTHGCDCTLISVIEGRVVSTFVPELQSNQEEADTRMLLHASHASSNGYPQVCIRSSDTDVEVLALYHQEAITGNITIASGTRSRIRLISIPQLRQLVGSTTCKVLPGLHAITGCDTVSAFVGKGKQKALQLMKEERHRDAIAALGERLPIHDDDADSLESFVCSLYDCNNTTNVNQARYSMFCKGNNQQSHQLPPTKAALRYHIKRANYQCYLWKNALHPIIQLQQPDGHGWKLSDGSLQVVWTDVAPAPSAIMELVCCRCKGVCNTRRCSCVKNVLPCTEACSCSEECTNTSNCSSEDDESDDELQ